MLGIDFVDLAIKLRLASNRWVILVALAFVPVPLPRTLNETITASAIIAVKALICAFLQAAHDADYKNPFLQQLNDSINEKKGDVQLEPAPVDKTRAAGVDSCIVCHGSYTNKAGIVRAQCGHVFHRLCFSKWRLELEKGQMGPCPSCNVPIKAVSGVWCAMPTEPIEPFSEIATSQ